MGKTCILTDSTAQFSRPSFPGRNLVSVIPLNVQYGTKLGHENSDLKVSSLPNSLRNSSGPHLITPSVDQFRQIFNNLSLEYSNILVLLISAHLAPLYQNAIHAANDVRGKVTITIIDSQTTSVGLGTLVQSAAEAASMDIAISDLERKIRGLIPHIYTVLCIPGLSYLNQAGFLGKAQAIVGELLNLLPIYGLEEGHLTPLEKVRSYRHLLDYFQEYLEEFSNLTQIALLQPTPTPSHEMRSLREFAQLNYPHTPFNEYPVTLPLASIFGPQTTGLIVVEQPYTKIK